MSDELTLCSSGIGKEEFVPALSPVASDVDPSDAKREAVPIHMGFVKFGGISVSDALPDSG